jgi:hypothetical protein
VPGAFGAAPLPKPKARICKGFFQFGFMRINRCLSRH